MLNRGTKIGLAFGLLGALAGMIASIIVVPVIGLVVSGVIALVFYILYRAILGPMFKQGRLLRSGERARAEVLEMWDTGWTINEQPRIGLRLKVFPDRGMPFESEAKVVVSRLQTHIYEVGRELTIRFDPARPEHIAVEAVGFQSAADTAGLEAQLRQIDAQNREVNQYGLAAMAIVKEVSDYGIPINDTLRFITLTVKVLPDSEDPFDAPVKGLFMEASLPKYQPGKEISVRFDKYDHTKVSIDFEKMSNREG